jgi:hypothetical protein
MFAILDVKTGAPVPRASITLPGGRTRHDLETGPEGRATLSFQLGCSERIYAFRGVVYTVYYSNWELGIEAEGCDPVRGSLGSYREDTDYPHGVVPPPIVIQIKRRAVSL